MVLKEVFNLTIRIMKAKIIIFTLLSLAVCACKKDWLSAKSDVSLVVPQTISDYQALLDNSSVMNKSTILDQLSSDDYYVLYPFYQTLKPFEQNAYVWGRDNLFAGVTAIDWYYPYQAVFYSNVVLEGANGIKPQPAELDSWNNIKGSALFYRAYSFYHLTQIFTKPYDKATVNTDLGVPLRLTSDVKEKSERLPLQKTYDLIIGDLQTSIGLLPVTPQIKTRPSKAAAYSLLAKIYLDMGDYNNALVNANAALAINGKLINYNTLTASSTYPIARFNDEVIFDSFLLSVTTLISTSNTTVDSTLYKSYDINDLRKTIFFKPIANTVNRYYFTGLYNGAPNAFGSIYGGIASDEMYLTRAECYARAGNKDAAMADINTLLSNRYKTGTFVSLVAATAQDALDLIVKERRKELLYRGCRFIDLRRLNKEPRYAVTLTRILNGQTYILAPNDPRYTRPIPDDIIASSGIQQNP